MIRKMLWPMLKKYRGMFFSMVAISVFGFALFLGIQSMLVNLTDSYEQFKNDYGNADIYLNSSYFSEKTADSILDGIDGIEEYETRVLLYSYLITPEDNTVTALMFSYKDGDFLKRCWSEELIREDIPNVEMERRYAENNNIRAGDTVTLSLNGVSQEVNVSRIVKTPETMYVAVSDDFTPDNTHIGYIYISEQDLVKLYDRIKSENLGLYLSNASTGFIHGGRLLYANQIAIKAEDGYDHEKLMDRCTDALESKDISVSSSQCDQGIPATAYMESCIDALSTAVICLPIIFYIIMLVVIALFINQIVQHMTNEIGIMSATGIEKRDVLKLLSVFALVMSGCAIFIGCFLGKVITLIMYEPFTTVYQLPVVSTDFDPLTVFVSVMSTIGVSQLAVLLSASRVFSITPKDAMTSNGSLKKKLPDWMAKGLAVFPAELRIAVSFLIQNPRRIAISIFSVCAALILVTVSLTFYQSINLVSEQSVGKRMIYDEQLLYNGENSSKFFEKLQALDCIDKIEEVYYAHVTVNGSEGIMQGIDEDTEFVYIPDETGLGEQKVRTDAVVFPTTNAEDLGLSKGDYCEIEGKTCHIANLSYQYANHKIMATKEYVSGITDNIEHAYLINTNDEKALTHFLTLQNDQCLRVNTESAAYDFTSRFSSLYVMVYIIIAIGLFMGSIILIVMGQSSLMEQKRTLCIMRSQGFSLHNISSLWIIQNLITMIPGIIAGIPISIGLEKYIFDKASAAASVFPVITDWPVYVLCTAFIVAVVFAAHYISMRLVKKWNLADSTRSRE